MVDITNARPLTASELARYRAMMNSAHDWRDTIPVEPAEAATEVGADQDMQCMRGIIIAVPAALLAWALIAAVAVAFKFWVLQ